MKHKLHLLFLNPFFKGEVNSSLVFMEFLLNRTFLSKKMLIDVTAANTCK